MSLSLFYMTSHLYPGIDFRTVVELRAFQSVALAFLFVPINTLVYADVRPEKNNRRVRHREPVAQHVRPDVGISAA